MTSKIHERIEVNNDELALGIILCDQFLFSMHFQASDLSLEPTIEQKLMFCDNSQKILLCTSRSVAKTVGLRGRILRDVVTYLPIGKKKDEEILVVTPAEGHLSPIVDALFGNISNNPLFFSLVTNWNKGDKPKIVTKTGLTVHCRIEGSQGTDTNMVGVHPFKIYGDEMAFGNTVCHRSRAGGAMPDCQWLYAGVPNGVRSSPFYTLDMTREGDDWSRHKFSMLTGNPLFKNNPKARAAQEKNFGGKGSPDYITQVLGQWGDEARSSFPSGSISWCTEDPKHRYYKVVLSGQEGKDFMAEPHRRPIIIPIPTVTTDRVAVGWDYGFSPDPSTLMFAIQNRTDKVWRTYARVSMYQIPIDQQVEIIKYLVESVFGNKVQLISVDNTPAQQLMLSPAYFHIFNNKVKQTLAGGTVEWDSVTGKPVTEANKDDVEIEEHRKQGKVIKQWRKYFLTEQLRRYMMNGLRGTTVETSLDLGYDGDLETEFVGTIERTNPSGRTVYEVPKSRGVGKVSPDQIVDAMRALTDSIGDLELVFSEGSDAEMLDMISSLGWSNPRGRGTNNPTWKAPWEHGK